MRLLYLFTSQQDYAISTKCNYRTIGGKAQHWQKKNPFNFAMDADHFFKMEK